MSKKIPSLSFRIDPGYSFDEELIAPEFSNNIVVGSIATDTENNCLFLGKVAEYGGSKNIWVDSIGAHAIYVIGKRRSGKTYSLGVIIEGLAANSWIKQGNQKQAIVLLDTMNVFISMTQHVEHTFAEESQQISEIKKWGLKSENFNIIYFHPRGTSPPKELNSKEIALRPADLTDQDWAALFGVDTYSDPLGQIISDIYQKVALEGYPTLQGGRIERNANYSVNELLNCLRDSSDIPNDYTSETIRAATARFRAINRLTIFSATGINIKEIFVPGQISILLLRDIDMNLRSLLIGTLIKKIMYYRGKADQYERLADGCRRRLSIFKDKTKEEYKQIYSQCEEYMNIASEGLPRGWIIIDEAHNYMPARGIIPSAEPLRKYVNEGRNLGLSIVVATQNPSGLDPAIRRNADISIIHSISMKDDISAIEGIINTFIPSTFTFGREKVSNRVFEQLLRSLPIGYAVISNDNLNRITVVKIRPRITVHGGMDY